VSSDYPQIPDVSGPPRPVLPSRLLLALLAFATLGLIGGVVAVLSGGGDDSADASNVETGGFAEAVTDAAAQPSVFLPGTATPVGLAGAVATPAASATALAAAPAATTIAAVPTAIPVATATPVPTVAAAVFVPQPEGANDPPPPTAVPQPTATPAPLPTTTPIARPTPVPSPTPVPFTAASVEPGTYYALVDDGLLVRDRPGGATVTTLQPSAPVVATGEAGQTAVRLWVQISSPVEGWVAAEFLGTDPPAEEQQGVEGRSLETAAAVTAETQGADPTPTPQVQPTPTPEPAGTTTSADDSSTTSSGATSGAAAAPGAPTAEQMQALRNCESGGNYAINTGNGYFGAYQFAQATWDGVAAENYPHLVGVVPSNAAPSEQDAMMIALHADRGFAPWPGCRASLGLP